jgi:GH25 family lysozyme M1 (1,4-beta-N-acetylmuramidase)
MTAPNVVNVTTITGKTDVANVTTSATAVTTCATNSVYKINSIIVSNIDGTNAADITIDLYRNSNAYHLASTITVPADSTLVVVNKDMGIYLEENDAIRGTASADDDLQVLCSYEVITDV